MGVGLMIAGPFLLVGLIALAVGWRYARMDRAIARWPRVRGRVLESDMKAQTSSSRTQSGATVRSTTHRLFVRYEYEVGGQTFTSENVLRTGWTTSDVNEASEMIARYRPGTSIDVLHDPAAPGTAYLMSGMSGGAIFLLIFGGVFFFVPLLVFAIVFAATR